MSGFKDVVGHRDIIGYIQDAVQQNKVSHAYILNGQRGSGKKMLAKLLQRLCSVKQESQNLVTNAVPVFRRIMEITRISLP